MRQPLRGYKPHGRKTPAPSLRGPPLSITYPPETTQPVTALVSEPHIVQQPTAGPSGVFHPAVVTSPMTIPATAIPPEMPQKLNMYRHVWDIPHPKSSVGFG